MKLEEILNENNNENPCWDGYEMVGMKTKDGKEVPNCVPEGVSEYDIPEDAVEIFGPCNTTIEEAEYQGQEVELNKPFRTPNENKKFAVYVKNPKGNVVKVRFGSSDMEIKRDDPDRKSNYRARHNCDNPGPKHKANYWSCRSWSGNADWV